MRFSRESGSYVEPFALTLSAPRASNVVIRYSLDGSLPTNGSPVYAGPILVTNSLRVRAQAEVPGSELLPGQPRSEAYTRVDPGTTANAVTFRVFSFDPTFAPAGKTAVVSILTTYNYAYWCDLREKDAVSSTVKKSPESTWAMKRHVLFVFLFILSVSENVLSCVMVSLVEP